MNLRPVCVLLQVAIASHHYIRRDKIGSATLDELSVGCISLHSAQRFMELLYKSSYKQGTRRHFTCFDWLHNLISCT